MLLSKGVSPRSTSLELADPAFEKRGREGRNYRGTWESVDARLRLPRLNRELEQSWSRPAVGTGVIARLVERNRAATVGQAMTESNVIETERLALRLLTLDDLDALAAIYRDKDVRKYFPEGTLTREQTKEELEWIINVYYGQYGFGLWATTHKETNEFIGRCGLLPCLGFIAPPAPGRGRARRPRIWSRRHMPACWRARGSYAVRTRSAICFGLYGTR